MQHLGITDRINSLSPELAEKIWKELKGNKAPIPKKLAKKTRVTFPPVDVIALNMHNPCISWQDAMRHLGEVLIQDVDKRSSATIKGQVVEAYAMLAEVVEDESRKRALLGKAMQVVMESDRNRLLERIATLATMI